MTILIRFLQKQKYSFFCPSLFRQYFFILYRYNFIIKKYPLQLIPRIPTLNKNRAK